MGGSSAEPFDEEEDSGGSSAESFDEEEDGKLLLALDGVGDESLFFFVLFPFFILDRSFRGTVLRSPPITQFFQSIASWFLIEGVAAPEPSSLVLFQLCWTPGVIDYKELTEFLE